MTNDATRATAEAMPDINRRRFLLNTTMTGVAVAVAAPAVAAEPGMTPRERAIWHMYELEHLVLADGASAVTIIVCGHGYVGLPEGKAIGLHPGRRLVNTGGMLAEEGGEA